MADKILLVEDESDMRVVFLTRLKINGYDVEEAVDGEEALAKAKSEKPDLILLDLMIPKINGFDVCRTLKFDDAFRKTPIVIISALSDQSEREKAIACGADSYFIKPFDLDLLLVKIRDLIDKSR